MEEIGKGTEKTLVLLREFKGDVSYFVNLCKAAKAAKMAIPQVINLLRIANNYLPSVQHRYEVLQKQNNTLESNLRTKAREFQSLTNQITYMGKRLDDIKSESENETATLRYLQQQVAKLETFAYNFKNNNKQYVEVIKSIENKISDFLSSKKTFLKIAIISVIESMRNNPEKYSALVYHNNYNQSSLSSISKYNNSNLSGANRQVVLPPPPYDGYIIEHYKDIMLETLQ
jgi:chromosome segregation ATPase